MHTFLAAVVLVACSANSADAQLPNTDSLSSWRSTEANSGWAADPACHSLVFNRCRRGSLIAADPVWEKEGSVALTLHEAHGPYAAVELRFRGTGDERNFCAVVLEPQRRRLTLRQIVDGRVVGEKTSSAELASLEWNKPYCLGYRILGRRATVTWGGREVLSAESLVPQEAGRIGLSAEFIHVSIRKIELAISAPEVLETFGALDAWKTHYGPDV
ncbi:MAG: hypothetical protein GXY83_04580 [Rhodopirellula sp.]|nr:hypothetical protein [Rhodopirellula sp.]